METNKIYVQQSLNICKFCKTEGCKYMNRESMHEYIFDGKWKIKDETIPQNAVTGNLKPTEDRLFAAIATNQKKGGE